MACCPCSVACCVQIPCIRSILRCCIGEEALKRSTERAAIEQASVHESRDALIAGDKETAVASLNTPVVTNTAAGGGIYAQTVGLQGKANRNNQWHDDDDDIILPHQRQYSAPSPRQAVGHSSYGGVMPGPSPSVGSEPTSPVTPLRRNRSVTFANNPAAIAASPTALVHSPPGQAVRPIRKRTSSYGPSGMLPHARSPPVRAKLPGDRSPPSIDEDLL
uniref:Uncharacterized protein n=1 Tax=Neobodo designis TaxID=312471 RepID=A0A7S1PQ53_NEODS|mmetsp:Transcript_15179/g.47050  ORF Transcript_15179/g.47050 Transcript_15179/m.47050 type:complete len:219 (+) Transcript_15179:112-768(+)